MSMHYFFKFEIQIHKMDMNPEYAPIIVTLEAKVHNAPFLYKNKNIISFIQNFKISNSRNKYIQKGHFIINCALLFRVY